MHLRNIVAAGVLALGLFAAASSANAVVAVATTTYTFSGACTDCTGTGVGTLVLQNYTPGQDLRDDEVISFDYVSNLVRYSFIEPSISGSLSNLPGQNGVSISGLAQVNGEGLAYTYFYSNTDGAWAIGIPAADYGSSHLWNGAAAAPEPSEWTLMIVGGGGAGLALRRARRRREPLAA